MNTRSLKHFLALSDALHFGRASDACNISLSALSRNIRQLEEELGVPLFIRDNRSVSLTPEGQKFRHYARDTISHWELLRSDLADSANELKGQVSMYCSVTASYSILYDLLNNFRQDFPGIKIQLHTGDPEHAITRVLSGKEDFTIAAHPASRPKGLEFKRVTISPLVFIAPLAQGDPDIPAAPPTDSKQWQQIPMIMSEGGVARKTIDAWFRKLDVAPKIYAQVAGNEAIVSMVSLGLGVGIVPKIVIDNSPMLERIKVWHVEPALEPYDVGVFTLKKNLRNPLVNAFWSSV